jgi:hypothetical protein
MIDTKYLRLLQWVEKAKKYIEMDARNEKIPLALQLLEEIIQLEMDYKK